MADRRREARLLLGDLRPRPRGAAGAAGADRIAGTAVPGSAHLTPDGVLNPCEMDVTVNWRRPSVCELTDPVRSPIAYLVERTDADAPDTGPYHLATRRAFEEGGEPEVVPAMIADPTKGRLDSRPATSSTAGLATACSTTACSAAICSGARAHRRPPRRFRSPTKWRRGRRSTSPPNTSIRTIPIVPAATCSPGRIATSRPTRHGERRLRSAGSGRRAGSCSSRTSTSSASTTVVGRSTTSWAASRRWPRSRRANTPSTPTWRQSGPTSRHRRPPSISARCATKERSVRSSRSRLWPAGWRSACAPTLPRRRSSDRVRSVSVAARHRPRRRPRARRILPSRRSSSLRTGTASCSTRPFRRRRCGLRPTARCAVRCQPDSPAPMSM